MTDATALGLVLFEVDREAAELDLVRVPDGDLV